MQIEMTLEQLKNFIPKLVGDQAGGAKFRAILKCIPVLEKSLLNNVFRKPHSDTVEIRNKRELATLIASGTNHKPAQARTGAPYSSEYLALKKRLGENYPHKFMNYGFWQGIDVDIGRGNSLRMKVEPIMKKRNKKTKGKTFDYLSHHEERRSVLKRAFLDAWQEIIDTIINHIAEEAKTS